MPVVSVSTITIHGPLENDRNRVDAKRDQELAKALKFQTMKIYPTAIDLVLLSDSIQIDHFCCADKERSAPLRNFQVIIEF